MLFVKTGALNLKGNIEGGVTVKFPITISSKMNVLPGGAKS